MFLSLIKVPVTSELSSLQKAFVGQWPRVEAFLNKSWVKSGSSTCFPSFDLVWITRPWHPARIIHTPVCSVSSPARSHPEDPGRYQSLACGIFVFSVTWDYVDVTPVWCIGSDCSGVLTAHKAISKEITPPWGWLFFKLCQLKKKKKKGYIAFRSVGPLNSRNTCMCLERLWWIGISHIPSS